MNSSVLQALGGLGLFLFGMTVMTAALRALADEKLRQVLAHTVNSPAKGAVTGALSTALLQSSSATTVAAVGFVGAGLLTFSESLGIIFGANIGTTITGWLVALVGFKLDLGQTLLPLILFGVLLRLLGRPRLEQVGMTVAGFGLIFVGIGVLQSGLSGLQGSVTPEQFPPDTIFGRLLLVLIGVIVTVVTQSSSAGVATALTAVHTGTISLNQAAAMVIGMDVGTTATAALATIGGNVQARRTGFAHVIYNTFTGFGAFLLLTPYMLTVKSVLPGALTDDPEMVLVGFHTFFNALGVIAVLPFTRRFADLLVMLIPERGNPLTRQLERSLMTNPVIAVTAVENTLWQVVTVLLGEVRRHLHDVGSTVNRRVVNDVSDAIEQCSSYLQELAARFRKAEQIHNYVACLHVLDHLRRIDARVREERRLRRCREDQGLVAMSDKLSAAASVMIGASHPLSAEEVEQIHSINRDMKIAMREYRASTLEQTAESNLTTSVALTRMDTARTLRRISYHVWRISHHLARPEAVLPTRRKEQSSGTEER